MSVFSFLWLVIRKVLIIRGGLATSHRKLNTLF